LLGLGAATKLYPALLVPGLVIVAVRRRGPREGVVAAAATLGTAAAVVLPFAVASPSGAWDALSIQFRGGLQIESLASSVIVMTGHAAEKLTWLGLPPPSPLTTHDAGGGLVRMDLGGSGVDVTKTVMDAALAIALCLLWIGVARSRRDPFEDLLRSSAATVAIVLALGTVLSPQYVTWLIPLVPLVGGRRGLVAIGLLVVVAVLTNVWFPGLYFDYQSRLDAGSASILLARNLALLALAVVLVLPSDLVRRAWAPPRR
jgi:hypothetical protein